MQNSPHRLVQAVSACQDILKLGSYGHVTILYLGHDNVAPDALSADTLITPWRSCEAYVELSIDTHLIAVLVCSQ